MGGWPWRYFVPYQSDVLAALESLRNREFAAGRYFKPDAGESLPPAHSIQEAVDRAGPSGTRSVLDMLDGISPIPRECCVSPLIDAQMIELFGTVEPTRELVERSLQPPMLIRHGRGLPELVQRGRGVYVVVYARGSPTELFFFGYSFD